MKPTTRCWGCNRSYLSTLKQCPECHPPPLAITRSDRMARASIDAMPGDREQLDYGPPSLRGPRVAPVPTLDNLREEMRAVFTEELRTALAAKAFNAVKGGVMIGFPRTTVATLASCWMQAFPQVEMGVETILIQAPGCRVRQVRYGSYNLAVSNHGSHVLGDDPLLIDVRDERILLHPAVGAQVELENVGPSCTTVCATFFGFDACQRAERMERQRERSRGFDLVADNIDQILSAF